MIFVSLVVGCLIGLFYRFFFVHIQKRIGFFMREPAQNTSNRFFVETIALSFIRIVLISSLLAYLLLSNSIHLILVTLSFGMTIYFSASIKDTLDGKH